ARRHQVRGHDRGSEGLYASVENQHAAVPAHGEERAVAGIQVRRVRRRNDVRASAEARRAQGQIGRVRMKTQWWLRTSGLAAIVAVVALVPVAGQRNPEAGGAAPQMRNPPPNVKKRTIVPPKWTPASRTPDGQPDLQGVWTNFDSTPME